MMTRLEAVDQMYSSKYDRWLQQCNSSPPTDALLLGFPCGSACKKSTCNAGDLGSIPGLGRSPGEGKGYPIQHSCLENSMDCTVHGVTKSWTQLSEVHFLLDFPGGSDGKASAYNARDVGSIPGSGRSPGEGNGNPLQYCCLENPMDGEA